MKISTIIEYLLGRDPLLKAEIRQWVNESEENKREYVRLKELLASKIVSDCSSEQALSGAVDRINGKIRKNKERRRLVRASIVSCSFAICLAVITIVGIYKYVIPEKYDVLLSNTEEDVSQYLLSDGTRIFLRKGTTLSYNDDFNQSDRTVSLDGEAYFEVARDENIPFFVKTPQTIVKVLGTSFNVKTEENTEVVLEKGRVAICDEKGAHYAELIPGNLAIVTEDEIQISSVNTSEYTRWRYNYKIYDRCSFDDFVNILENKFDVRFIYDPTIFKNTYFKMAITEEDTLEDILSMMAYIAKLNYEVKGNNIIVNK